jgi:hypothetical protein
MPGETEPLKEMTPELKRDTYVQAPLTLRTPRRRSANEMAMAGLAFAASLPQASRAQIHVKGDALERCLHHFGRGGNSIVPRGDGGWVHGQWPQISRRCADRILPRDGNKDAHSCACLCCLSRQDLDLAGHEGASGSAAALIRGSNLGTNRQQPFEHDRTCRQSGDY